MDRAIAPGAFTTGWLAKLPPCSGVTLHDRREDDLLTRNVIPLQVLHTKSGPEIQQLLAAGRGGGPTWMRHACTPMPVKGVPVPAFCNWLAHTTLHATMDSLGERDLSFLHVHLVLVLLHLTAPKSCCAAASQTHGARKRVGAPAHPHAHVRLPYPFNISLNPRTGRSQGTRKSTPPWPQTSRRKSPAGMDSSSDGSLLLLGQAVRMARLKISLPSWLTPAFLTCLPWRHGRLLLPALHALPQLRCLLLVQFAPRCPAVRRLLMPFCILPFFMLCLVPLYALPRSEAAKNALKKLAGHDLTGGSGRGRKRSGK